MTWSYSTALATDKDRVRFYTGDTLSVAQQVSDEEIAGVLAMHSNVYVAAAAVCRHLAARYSALADIAIDDMRKSLSQRSAAYASRAGELEAQATSSSGSGSVAPRFFAGGISTSGKQVRQDNGALVQPLFSRDAMDFQNSLTTGDDDDGV